MAENFFKIRNGLNLTPGPLPGTANLGDLAINEVDGLLYVGNGSGWDLAGATDHTALSNIGTNTHDQIDTHISATSIHFTKASISHTEISDIGANSHAQIDTHISSTSNPHSVTKSQVGLGNVTDDAQLKRAAGDINTFTAKTVPVGADILLLEDSADSFNKKKVTLANLGISAPVSAIYNTAAGQSIANNTSTIIDFGTVEHDPSSRVTTGSAWKFTAEEAGVYEISSFVQLSGGGGWTAGEEAHITLFKNNSSIARLGLDVAQTAHTQTVPIICSPRQIFLAASDFIDLRITQNSGGAISLVNVASVNWVSIKKVG